MTITVTTDASFYNHFKAAGFAFWISTDLGKVKHSGVLNGAVNNAQEAEFKAILNALHIIGVRIKKEIKKIIINTDCLCVIQAVNNDLPIGWASDLMKEYKRIISQFGECAIEFRHVKAHKHTKTARHWVNEWCDVQAKKAIQEKLFGDVKK